jgi:hypothetical protein
MIQELVNYSEWLKKDFPDLFEGSVTEGLHILINLDDNGCVVEDSYKSEVFEKGLIPSRFLNDVKKREIISNALGNNKGIADKVIFSNNPYAIFFKLYFTKAKKEKMLNVEEYKEFVEKYRKTEKSFENIKEEFFKKFINHRLEIAFMGNNKENKSIDTYYKRIEKKYFKIDEKSIEKQYVENTKKYVKNKLKQAILDDDNFRKMFLFEKDKEKKKEIEFKSTFFDKQIRVNFNIPVEILQKASNRYFSENIFNVAKFNQTIKSNEFGLSNFYNKAAEDKKLFNLHKTAFYKPNNLIERNWGILLNEFLNASKFLPKVLPVFIDKDELNARVIKIFKSDYKIGYKEIISNIANNYEDDLQNYYLLNFWEKEIKDLDFVSSFNFKQKIPWSNPVIALFFEVNKKSVFYSNITNVFNIEEVVNKHFFYKKLSYFGNIKKTETTPNFLINNFHKYNKLLYDAFYKSRLHLITANIFKDICMPVIRHEISHDELNNKGYSKHEYKIKEKLLIYIHLNKLFDKNNINFGGIDMPSELPRYYDNLLSLLRGEVDYYQSDEDFAFGTGQLIRYLLEQSESGNKNHSMFEPFLQKLGNFNVFITQINRSLKTYSHKIKMNYDTFDTMMSNSTSYKLDADKSLKELETILVSGYFANSAIWQIIEERKKEQKRKQIEEKNNEGEKNE